MTARHQWIWADWANSPSRQSSERHPSPGALWRSTSLVDTGGGGGRPMPTCFGMTATYGNIPKGTVKVRGPMAGIVERPFGVAITKARTRLVEKAGTGVDVGFDLVIEATWVGTKPPGCGRKHLQSGAKKVIIFRPGEG
jgi:hypothetical protein